MASIFTYDPNPPRISSPWSTPGTQTPTTGDMSGIPRRPVGRVTQTSSSPLLLQDTGITRLEAEPQEGSTEYKLHLLLRSRRNFSSSSTSATISGSHHSNVLIPGSDSNPDRDVSLPRTPHVPSSLTRQVRLQQLTTQLLWRLQQSSPFHSSSMSDLVLPVLPEATPTLGNQTKRASLLPGLEESQGALYEIGVSDDGTLIGLIEEELEESLTNLKAMAASLGCVVEMLRKVAVGHCEWVESVDGGKSVSHAGRLWVAEALVRPDLDSTTEQIHTQRSTSKIEELNPASQARFETPPSKSEQFRVTLTGSTTAGKSSLLGTLSTSTLDNGRGKSRLSLLRHRHEITTGVTSSVAQELLGYRSADSNDGPERDPDVVNYASDDVSSWNDMHHLADRLIFLSDSPGQPRYAKSSFRTLVSWDPHWTIVCVPADDDEVNTGRIGATASVRDVLGSVGNVPSESLDVALDLSVAHIRLCLKLRLPLVVAITKMDLATKPGLRQTLTKVLSTLKEAGRRPVMLSSSSATKRSDEASPNLQRISLVDQEDVSRVITTEAVSAEDVPIVMTSAVSGAGIGKLHALLRSLPLTTKEHEVDITPLNQEPGSDRPQILFSTDEVFSIPPSKVYASSASSRMSDHGVVLCGHLSHGTISVGDNLSLGPFTADSVSGDFQQENGIRRSSSYSASLGDSLSKGSPHIGAKQNTYSATRNFSTFIDVRVVSLRNLRLPVRSLLEGQVGTIGVEPTEQCHLARARKGMVLVQKHPNLTAYRSFSASFPSADFASSSSPPLILGGHAIIYVNSVRAAVKVTSVSLIEQAAENVNVFDFESDASDASNEEKQVKITFRFVSSVEWMQIGDKILVVPTASTTGPVAGAVMATTGLAGFVGRVCEVL